MGGPGFPGVASVLVYLGGAVEILRSVAGSMAIIAFSPVDIVDLPEPNIRGSVAVVMHVVGIACALVRYDASTTLLIPTIPSTPSADIFHFPGVPAETRWASTRAVASASVSRHQRHQQSSQ